MHYIYMYSSVELCFCVKSNEKICPAFFFRIISEYLYHQWVTVVSTDASTRRVPGMYSVPT